MRPLSGVRVLDLSRLIPGPFATSVLCDLGASVDKVEDPHPGDYLRHVPPFVEGVGAVFLALNRKKRSLVLDLKGEAGKKQLLSLVKRYDILVESFRPGTLDRLGLSHARLLEENPRLILCAITGYGQTGPVSNRAGHDLNYLARAGLLGLSGPPEGPPAVPGFQVADIGGALTAVVQMLAALRLRDREGVGSILDVSLHESCIPFALSSLAALPAGGVSGRGLEMLTGGAPAYGIYETKDGRFVAFAALEPKFWKAFSDGVGIDASQENPQATGNEKLRERLRAIFRGKTLAEWRVFSEARDACLEPVLTPEELMSDAHLAARGRCSKGRPLTPFESGGEGRAPSLGEHTDEILREVGETPPPLGEGSP